MDVDLGACSHDMSKVSGASLNTPIYAVGDIHGRYDLLDQALDLIASDAGERPAQVVFLGDYVDRGPDSREVIAALIKGPRRPADRFVCLMGNHERMMLDAESDGAARSMWLRNGGEETRDSYRGAADDAHLDWLASLPLLYETDHHLFVHAGLMPGHSIDEQEEEWLLWIRRPFLEARPEWGRHVVHGHTPQWAEKPDPAEPEVLAHRTNLDTKAYETGVLTVGVFEGSGGPRRLLRSWGRPG